VAGIGARAWLRADTYPQAWEDQTIDGVALSADRQTLSIRSDEVNLSCQEARAEVRADGGEWTVSLEARQTKAYCLVGVCIGPKPPAGPATTLALGEEMVCSTLDITLDDPVPDEVEVVAA